MKKIIYLAAIAAALFLAVHSFYLRQTPVSDFGLGINLLISFFLIVFGAYGLYAERLFNRFRSQGKTENLCVEASYHVQKMGMVGRLFLFPFVKIKSGNSFVVSFLGALAWVIILMIIFQALKK
jgi:hypothetical protein